jgi:hypothetical protein
VPGLDQAEACLAGVEANRVVLMVVGARRWPRPVTADLGPRVLAQQTGGRIVFCPRDRHLAISGIDAGPLPPPVQHAARQALRSLADVETPKPDDRRRRGVQDPRRRWER